MSLDLSALDQTRRLLFEIPLRPLQGRRFQPTGFPGLGAATFRSPDGECLLVESAQSMANRLELTIWDKAAQNVKDEFKKISHVRVIKNNQFLTDTILESHRLNSPYLLENPDTHFLETLRSELGSLETGPIDRKKLTSTLLKYDVGSLLHGVFLTKKSLAGGRLRVARAISAFIEADGVRVAASGGVKNDHVNPSWPTADVARGYGSVPFARDEFTAERITLYVNIDLAQIHGYGFAPDVQRMLVLMALYKLRALLSDDLRLRSACDLTTDTDTIVARLPQAWILPELPDLADALQLSIQSCAATMSVKEVTYTGEIRTRKPEEKNADDGDDEAVE